MEKDIISAGVSVFQFTGVAGVLVNCMAGPSGNSGEGGGMTTQPCSCFEANPGHSICSKTFGGDVSVNSSLLQVLFQEVDGGFCLLRTMLDVV